MVNVLNVLYGIGIAVISIIFAVITYKRNGLPVK